ncbi:hypothetical protein V2J09_008593 [Rumex salicifolius]
MVNCADRIYATYYVYKGKAALSVHPVSPRLVRLDSGGLKVDKQGCMMLTFTPSAGERKYDWERKQLFALSPTEAGSLISMAHNDSCEFFHDPSMKSSNAGQVRKSLSVKPSPGGGGLFFSLNVVNNIQQTNERLTVPVTTAEFAVIRTSFSYALPHLLGWDLFSNNQPKESKNAVYKDNKFGFGKTTAEETMDLEWGKGLPCNVS